MKLYMIRHGESEFNAGRTAHLDSPLTGLGRRQAALSARRLAGEGVTRIFVSPLRRTIETAAPISAAAGIRAEAHAEVYENFCSVPYLTFPGRTGEALRRDYPDVTLGDAFQPGKPWWPGELEDADALHARMSRVRDQLLGDYSRTAESILIVSHSDPIGSLIEAFLRINPDPEGPPWSENCAITLLDCPADPEQPASLLYANDTTHLTDL